MDRFEGSSLNQMAADGRADQILKAIQSGVDVTQDDNAALRFAVVRGHVSAATVLLKAGAIADKRMLVAAIRSGKIDLIKCVLEAGVIADYETLVAAIRSGEVDSLKYLIDIDIPCNPPMKMADTFWTISDAELLSILISEKDFPAYELIENTKFRVIDGIAHLALSKANIELFLLANALGAKVTEPIDAFTSLFAGTKPPLRQVLRTANIAKLVLCFTDTHLLDVEKEIAENCANDYEDRWHVAHKVFSKWRNGEFNKMSAKELEDFDQEERQRYFPG